MAGRTADVRRALLAAGGVATHAELAAAVSARAVRTAAQQRLILTIRPGLYALPALTDSEGVALRPGASADERAAARAQRVGRARRTAAAAHGAMSHRSAAEYYGLPLLVDAGAPEIIVRRGRRAALGPLRVETVRERALTARELREGVTAPLRTVLDCAVDLPEVEALAVLDSALRGDDDHAPLVARSQLLDAADRVAARHRRRVRDLVAAADGRAANPAETALRHLAAPLLGPHVQPQLEIRCGDEQFRVDLGDPYRRLVIEFDSAEWHGASPLTRDCRRYTMLTSHGWVVLRFTWEDINTFPERTAEIIARAALLCEATCRRCAAS